MIKIMFVCLGNICRSTMSEFVMKAMIKEEGLEDKFFVASSATSNEAIGCDIHRGTKFILEKYEIPYTHRAAVRLQKSDYDKYDYFIGMEETNIRDMKKILGSDKKIYKLLEFAGEGGDISDPWYTHDFDATYADVTKGCRALLDMLKKTTIYCG